MSAGKGPRIPGFKQGKKWRDGYDEIDWRPKKDRFKRSIERKKRSRDFTEMGGFTGQ